MNKPIFYKSFRSRRYLNKESLLASTIDFLNSDKKIILDIGFGTGESTIALNSVYKDYLVIGLEAYKPGIKNLVNKNIQTHYGDALVFIEKLDNETVAKIYMLFPDPWQKKKHRKRRLFNDYTFRIINRILIKKGVLHFASDNINYAIQAKEIIQNMSERRINFSKNRGNRPITRFESKALAKNKFVFDIIYART